MDLPLNGHLFLMTGASAAIGRATAMALAAEDTLADAVSAQLAGGGSLSTEGLPRLPETSVRF